MSSALLLLAIIGSTIVGDYFVKAASDKDAGILSVVFLTGATVYGCTAIGFYFMLRSNSLATVGVLYSAATIIMMAALGFFVFKEPMGAREVLGIALALAAVIVVGH